MVGCFKVLHIHSVLKCYGFADGAGIATFAHPQTTKIAQDLTNGYNLACIYKLNKIC